MFMHPSHLTKLALMPVTISYCSSTSASSALPNTPIIYCLLQHNRYNIKQ
jgi:hypothetical protein